MASIKDEIINSYNKAEGKALTYEELKGLAGINTTLASLFAFIDRVDIQQEDIKNATISLISDISQQTELINAIKLETDAISYKYKKALTDLVDVFSYKNLSNYPFTVLTPTNYTGLINTSKGQKKLDPGEACVCVAVEEVTYTGTYINDMEQLIEAYTNDPTTDNINAIIQLQDAAIGTSEDLYKFYTMAKKINGYKGCQGGETLGINGNLTFPFYIKKDNQPYEFFRINILEYIKTGLVFSVEHYVDFGANEYRIEDEDLKLLVFDAFMSIQPVGGVIYGRNIADVISSFEDGFKDVQINFNTSDALYTSTYDNGGLESVQFYKPDLSDITISKISTRQNRKLDNPNTGV